MSDGPVTLSASTYDLFHDNYVALGEALAAYRSALRSGEPESDQLREMGDAALAMKASIGRDRLWVSGDRCTFVRIWASGECEIAYRSDPAHTWGPPITLTEEKT